MGSLGCDAETNAPRLREAMVLAQVAVGFHTQWAAVFVSKPARNSGNIDTAFDANGREQMTEVVVSYPLHTDLRRRMCHAILTFKDAHYGCVRRFIRSLGAQFRQHPLKFWNHRHISHLAVLGCGLRVASHVQLATAKVCVCPRHVFCLANSQAAISEKPHEISAVLRLSCSRSANLLNKFQEFFA